MFSSGRKLHFERLKRHISVPQEWKVLGEEDDDDETVADPNPEDPVEQVASDVEKGSFVEEQRLSDAADELSEWGPASDSHAMQTRTRTALQEGRSRRCFEQYADYSSSDEQSVGEEAPDVRLPQKDNAGDLFMEDLLMDSEEERQAFDRLPVEKQFSKRAAEPEDWDRVPTQDDRHISDSSMPEVDDPLDSILRRQLPRQTRHPHSDASVEETSKMPTDQKVEAPSAKRTSDILPRKQQNPYLDHPGYRQKQTSQSQEEDRGRILLKLPNPKRKEAVVRRVDRRTLTPPSVPKS